MKVILPIFFLAAAAVLTGLLLYLKPEAEEAPVERPLTRVEVLTVEPEGVRLTVRSQGTVLPEAETALSVEVAGRVIELSEQFRAGGRVEEGDLLFRIDPADYEAAAAARAAELAEAELALAQEKALAEQAVADWEAMGRGEASTLTLRKPQLARAKALVASAEAALEKARRDLARTEVRAPYDGRVLSKSIDLGQYVAANPANPVAVVFATDRAEIRLPLTEREADYIDLRTREVKKVRIFANEAPERLLRVGRLARFEATIDPLSRLTYAVAVVEDPFRPKPDQPAGAALRRGQFVRAEIEGRRVEDVFVLPRYALRGTDTVYLLTDENRLVTRQVEILKSDFENVFITGGLAPGEKVVTSPVAYFVENMPAEVVETTATGS